MHISIKTLSNTIKSEKHATYALEKLTKFYATLLLLFWDLCMVEKNIKLL